MSGSDPLVPNPFTLVCDRQRFALELWKWNAHLGRDERVRTFTVAIGQVGYKTRHGLYRIVDWQHDPTWTIPDSAWARELGLVPGTVIPAGDPNNPIKARWLGFYDGMGLHGTDNIDSLGTAASHGCIRMHIPDIEWLFPKVKGTGYQTLTPLIVK